APGPSPVPSPPGPVPAPPQIPTGEPPTRSVAAVAGGRSVVPGGAYVRPDWRATLGPPAPTQRPQGTVYGGPNGLPTSANVDAPLEHSGSLTGLVLAQGQRAERHPDEQRSRTTRVVLILAAVFVVVVVVSGVVAYYSSDIINGLVNGGK